MALKWRVSCGPPISLPLASGPCSSSLTLPWPWRSDLEGLTPSPESPDFCLLTLPPPLLRYIIAFSLCEVDTIVFVCAIRRCIQSFSLCPSLSIGAAVKESIPILTDLPPPALFLDLSFDSSFQVDPWLLCPYTFSTFQSSKELPELAIHTSTSATHGGRKQKNRG
ncbi:hypothetical protein DL98DRAFT_628461 [Cadophora sp. DSE1049]|nr:hypothetical protein DL98DRAFT_628461 [Cadophora sp. DSE1049]